MQYLVRGLCGNPQDLFRFVFREGKNEVQLLQKRRLEKGQEGESSIGALDGPTGQDITDSFRSRAPADS